MNIQYSLKSIGKNCLACGILRVALKQHKTTQQKDTRTMASKIKSQTVELSEQEQNDMNAKYQEQPKKRTRNATIFMSPLTRKLAKSQAEAMEITPQNLVDALVLQFMSPLPLPFETALEKTKDGLDRTTYKQITDAYWAKLEADNRRMREELRQLRLQETQSLELPFTE